MIPFNKPFISGKEVAYIKEAVAIGKISGNGIFTEKCHNFFSEQYGFKKCLLTTSCTSALEMTSILLDIKPGDEIILPSYTFVSVANAFILRGAKLVFADCSSTSPHLDPDTLPQLISSKTKAIVVVHYGGVACAMDEIMKVAEENNIYVIEDAAHAIDAYYNKVPLGSIGHFATFSFHETKNVMSGEGGMLVVNDPSFEKRADIIWEKGTNRKAFFNGEVKKYEWIDIGSSFIMSEIQAAYLYAQLENLYTIQEKRSTIWNTYANTLQPLVEKGMFKIAGIPIYAAHNSHIFYLLLDNIEQREAFISFMKSNRIKTVFHYLPLHLSPYFKEKYQGGVLPNTQKFADCLVRLPIYHELSDDQQKKICALIYAFFMR